MINSLVKNCIKDLLTYKANDNRGKIIMDANESFLNVPEDILQKISKKIMEISFNRYPDPDAYELLKAYGDYAGCSFENLIAGNGSDEIIDMIVKTFVDSGDKILTLTPDFSMYGIYAKAHGGEVISFKTDENFMFNVDDFIEVGKNNRVKVIFFSNPNNPTGRVINRAEILKIVVNSNSIVVVDEAYFEFYGESVIDRINDYENLIVLRTCSKAFGAAALRLGFMASNIDIVREVKKAKSPYNLNGISQTAGCIILQNREFAKENIRKILEERNYLKSKLDEISGIKTFNTGANFMLIKLPANFKIDVFNLNNISIRYFNNGELDGYLRVTVSSRYENNRFLEALKNTVG